MVLSKERTLGWLLPWAPLSEAVAWESVLLGCATQVDADSLEAVTGDRSASSRRETGVLVVLTVDMSRVSGRGQRGITDMCLSWIGISRVARNSRFKKTCHLHRRLAIH